LILAMRRNLHATLAFGLSLLCASCQTVKPQAPMEPGRKYIGSVEMTRDGVLHVALRVEEDGMRGDSWYDLKRGDPRYDEMIQHVGGLKRGKSKSVPAFP
jgi:hypothetical protein